MIHDANHYKLKIKGIKLKDEKETIISYTKEGVLIKTFFVEDIESNQLKRLIKLVDKSIEIEFSNDKNIIKKGKGILIYINHIFKMNEVVSYEIVIKFPKKNKENNLRHNVLKSERLNFAIV